MTDLGTRLQSGLTEIRGELEAVVLTVVAHGGSHLVTPALAQLAAPLRRIGAHVPELGEPRSEDPLRFRIAVIGRFTTGKSTLLSAIAGSGLTAEGAEGGLLPESDSPCTAIPTFLSHDAECLKIHLVARPRDGERPISLRQEISIQELKAMHFHPAGTDGADPFPDVARIEIEGALPDTFANVVLIDTLGDDDKPESTARTLEVIQDADAVVILFRADMGSIATGDELAFLAKAAPARARGGKKVFYLINQFAPQDYDEDDIAYLWSLILTEQGRAGPYDSQKLADGDIFVIDALSAKQGRLESCAERVEGSGLLDFEARLAEYLLNDGLRGKVQPAIGDLIDTITEIQAEIRRDLHRMRNRRVNAESTAQAVAKPLTLVIETLTGLKDETKRTAASITAQIRQSFEAAMMSSVNHVGDVLDSYEVDSLKGWVRKLRHLVTKKRAVEEVQKVLQDTLQSRMEEWASDFDAVSSPARIFEGEQMALIDIIARRFAQAEIELEWARRTLLGDETETATQDVRTRVSAWRARLQTALSETVRSQVRGIDFTGDYLQAAFGAAVMIGLAKVGLVPVVQATLLKIGLALGINAVAGAASVVALPITAAAAALGALFMNRGAADKVKRKALNEFSKKMEQTTQSAWSAFYRDLSGTIAGARAAFDRQIDLVAAGASEALRGLLNEAEADIEQFRNLINERERDLAAVAAAKARLEAMIVEAETSDDVAAQ